MNLALLSSYSLLHKIDIRIAAAALDNTRKYLSFMKNLNLNRVVYICLVSQFKVKH